MDLFITDLIFRLFLNLITLVIISWGFYFSSTKRKEYVFTFVIIGVTVFVLCYMLSNINLELGIALGLFAVFGILRYRTHTVQIREMTYLFLSITISLINSMTVMGYDALNILAVNGAVVIIAGAVELIWFRIMPGTITIRYENIDLIRPERREELKADLEKRIGIEVMDFQIGSINFLRDTARIEILYDTRKYPGYISDYQE